MKKIFLFLFLSGLIINGFSQKANQITTFMLPNGMKVLLCEDHAQPQIYGAVCVHVGSKNDPADNTGMAHYFEHIMFKGTDQIGTLDWKAEKMYLDSISMLYDQLHTLTDAGLRNNILMKINNLSNVATQYAIPNEVDVILSKMGGQGVNAFTSNDVTVYHNLFPSNQLEKWLLVYAERFRNPVFRLFQTELEAVYEEYNMYQDEPMGVFMEDALATAYGEHPYGRPVIGYPKHLKNPQTSAMQKFFNTYYHPTNMTLILVGDFNIETLIPLLNETIGAMHNEGEGVSFELAHDTQRMKTDINMPIKPFKGHQIETVKETPVKMGIIGYQTPGNHETDALYLDILSGLLSNNSETGLIDKLTHTHQLMMAQCFNYAMLEAGTFTFLYVPKIIGQSHEDAENLIFAAIDSIRQGKFGDDLFEAVKMDYLREYVENMESLDDKFNTLLDLEMNGLEPQDYEKREMLIRSLTKKDLIRIANQYLGDNCLIFRSNMGHKNTEKLQKPQWKPIVAKNTEASSSFAQKIEKMPVKDIKPQTINFEKDLVEVPVADNFMLYWAPNPYNDIFSLNILYDYGLIQDPKLSTAINYLNKQGTQKQTFEEFQLQLQKIGASLDIYVSDNELHIVISGFDKDFETILQLCSNKIFFPGNDEKKLDNLIEEMQSSIKLNKNSASTWGRALYNYACYGQNSLYLTNPTLNEVKSYSGSDLLQSFKNALQYSGTVAYVGNRDFKDVASAMKSIYHLGDNNIKKGDKPVRPVMKYDKPIIYLASNKKFLQSNIYFYILGDMLDQNEWMTCRVYNEYMGGSMAGVIFQEIRELRSLGYSAYGQYSYDGYKRRPGFTYGYLGTQSDKTNEGCEAMSELLLKMPVKPEKFEMAKTSVIHQTEANYVNFRQIPLQVKRWKDLGYLEDPRARQLEDVSTIDMERIVKFYEKHIANRNMVITIAGDKKRIDVDKLAKSATIIELKSKEFMPE